MNSHGKAVFGWQLSWLQTVHGEDIRASGLPAEQVVMNGEELPILGKWILALAGTT